MLFNHIIHNHINPNSNWLVTSRFDTTRHVRRVKLVEQHGPTRLTRLARVVSTVETWRDEPSGIWAIIDRYKQIMLQFCYCLLWKNIIKIQLSRKEYRFHSKLELIPFRFYPLYFVCFIWENCRPECRYYIIDPCRLLFFLCRRFRVFIANKMDMAMDYPTILIFSSKV